MNAPRRPRLLLASLAFAVFACSSPAPPDTLLLSVTSDAPLGGERLGALRVMFASGGERFPDRVTDTSANFALGQATNPTNGPVFISIDYPGDRFGDGVSVPVAVFGLSAGTIVVGWDGRLQLRERAIVNVHLRALSSACDADGDGFLDCAVAGCCGSESGSIFSDCEPADPQSHPWATEPECEPCQDVADQDCSGSDQPCVDADGDGVADCLETCGVDDPMVAPGLPELCDGLDNDCDGAVDEGFTIGGAGVGQSCGVGACAGGAVECDAVVGVRCSSAGNASDELCDGLDNDCDGLTDEACIANDTDGDGYTTEAGDCDDYDAAIFPGAEEACCPAFADGQPEAEAACDRNCDLSDVTFCQEADADGDGFVPPADCDDSDPLTYPGAPERCEDGVDQDCFGGDLQCAGLTDEDLDGWPAAADCDDTDPAVGIGAPELCDAVDNDCDGIIDEGNPGGGDVCGTSEGVCEPGILVCDNSEAQGVLNCMEDVEATSEVCDGLDNDCDGDTDEGFTYAGSAIGDACVGIGACGAGQVVCSLSSPGATCSSNPDGTASQAQTEVCDDVDNDCDGQLNEGLTDLAQSTCSKVGVCGAALQAVQATCNQDTTGTWSCVYDAVPNYSPGFEPVCDGLDNDCDGETDEDFGAGQGCEGADPDLCANGIVTCDASMLTTYCDESNAAASTEICDGLDNDCDGLTDEGFPDLGAPCDGVDTDSCANGVYTCAEDGSGQVCAWESVTDIADVCDGIDNDCDGLTDEPYPLVGKPCDGADSDECANGTYECHADTTQLQCVNETSQDIVELCDGIDNDCDGLTDEAFALVGTPCDGDDSDQCARGTYTCNAAADDLECVNESQENIGELCDGVDNDCDGETDENFKAGGTVVFAGGSYASDAGKTLGESCGAGVCAGGFLVCASSGLTLRCSTDNSAVTELCNGVDDDCDGETDEPFTDGTVTFDGGPHGADAGAVLGDGCGIGVCAGGLVVCDGDSALTCSTLSNASVEGCDGADNDCDGALNEDLTDVAQSSCLKTGVCSTSVVASCNADTTGTWTCDYSGVAGFVTDETAAWCDGEDNDCDGVTDEDPGCSGLDETGLVARYFIDEAASGAVGPVEDSGAGAPVDLTIDAPGGQPYYQETAGRRALRWDSVGAGGSAKSVIDGTKLAELHQTTTMTIELVAEITVGSNSPSARLLHVGTDGDSTTRFGVHARLAGVLMYQYRPDGGSTVVGAQWNDAWSASTRVVYHLVWDTTQGVAANRIRLYEGGDLVPITIAYTLPAQNAQLFIDDEGLETSLFLGNTGAASHSPRATIYYAALYDHAMPTAQIATNAAALAADDDTP